MHKSLPIILFVIVTVQVGNQEVNCLPAVFFPFLPGTEWYYKPSPKEQVVLGLLLNKVLATVLAMRVGAALGIGKRSLNDAAHSQFAPHLKVHDSKRYFPSMTKRHSQIEIKLMDKIFQQIRVIDQEECFLKLLCAMSQDEMINRSGRYKKYLDIIRVFNNQSTSNLRSVFHHAITLQDPSNCNSMYSKCPMSPQLVLSEESFFH